MDWKMSALQDMDWSKGQVFIEWMSRLNYLYDNKPEGSAGSLFQWLLLSFAKILLQLSLDYRRFYVNDFLLVFQASRFKIVALGRSWNSKHCPKQQSNQNKEDLMHGGLEGDFNYVWNCGRRRSSVMYQKVVFQNPRRQLLMKEIEEVLSHIRVCGRCHWDAGRYHIVSLAFF